MNLKSSAAPTARHKDTSFVVLLAVQCLIMFVLVPIGALWNPAPLLLDAGHFSFAVVCACALTKRRSAQIALLTVLVAIAVGPIVWHHLAGTPSVGPRDHHAVIAFVAFAFNVAVTALVARAAFAPGRVTAHRILGAVLIYLNVAALFAIAYELVSSVVPGAIGYASGRELASAFGARLAEFTYFSLTTITTCGYGDLMPTNALARSFATLEATFGQLFPAIFLSRLVALHLAHSAGVEQREVATGPARGGVSEVVDFNRGHFARLCRALRLS